MAVDFTYRYAPISGKFGSKQHLAALHHLRDLLKQNILGEQDKQWRDELVFILGRTNKKIRQVEGHLVGTSVL